MNQSLQSQSTSSTTTASRRYVPLPIDYRIKIFVGVTWTLIGVYAVMANILIVYLMRKNQAQRRRQPKRTFRRNLTSTFIKSLAWSGLLCGIITCPITIVSFSVDILRFNWVCKTVRYFNIVFSVVMLINLIIIGTERYLGVFYPFLVLSNRIVRRFVVGAWTLGFVVPLLPASRFTVATHDLGQDSYTFICVTDKKSKLNRVGMIILGLILYAIPVIYLMVIDIRILIALKRRQKNSKNRLVNISSIATNTFVLLIFSVIIPYSVAAFYPGLRLLVKMYLSYEVDKMMRHLTELMAFSNAAITPTVIIYCMPDLRTSLKRLIQRRSRVNETNVVFQAKSERCVIINFVNPGVR